MRINFTLGLAAMALSFNIAGSAAATIDVNQQAKQTAASSSLMPSQGSLTSGFSTMKAQKDSRQNAASFVELSGGGLAALAAVVPSAAASATSSGVQEAVMAPAGMQFKAQGFSAIEAATGRETENGLESLRAEARSSAPDNLLARPSK